MSTKRNTRKTTLTTYVPVADNIYHDGFSYRVRVARNGVKTSKNFSNKREAVKFRNKLMA
jgi:hypothetical protein